MLVGLCAYFLAVGVGRVAFGTRSCVALLSMETVSCLRFTAPTSLRPMRHRLRVLPVYGNACGWFVLVLVLCDVLCWAGVACETGVEEAGGVERGRRQASGRRRGAG